ncbi:glycosyltransferase [bacterium]|nr:glycosyltransferase [bacterium]
MTEAEPRAAAAEKPTVTIIVPCRNEAGFIGPFLDDLAGQTGLATPPEIIIADGESDDGTRGIIESRRERLPGLRVLANPERIVSTGLNRAIREARGEFIIRMDVHTTYAEDYCAACLAAIRRTGAANVGGPARTRAQGAVAEAIAAAYASRFAVGGARFHFADYEGEVDTVTYGCWRRETLLEIGLFDEGLVRNQDDELNYRLRRAGGVIWQDPRIRSWYHPRNSFGRLFRQYYQYGYWKPAVIARHGSPASLRHLVPAGFVAAGIVSLVAGVVWRPALVLFGLWAAAYLLFVLAGTVSVGRRRGWRLAPLLPVAFFCYHFGYGLGFLRGLLFPPRGRGDAKATDLTR